MKRTICVVITARPSYSRIRSALFAIKAHPDLDLKLVVCASALLDRYGSAINQIKDDGFTIDAQVYMVLEGENLASMAKTTGIGLLELTTVFDNIRPDAVVSVADRYETIATAIAAAYMNIPLVHIQGGEITGSIDEKVRHAITKLADLHLVSSEAAAERVKRMGERHESVYVTGCPSIDIAAQVAKNPELDFDPFQKYGGVGVLEHMSGRGYIVVMQHPVTTEHQLAKNHAFETLRAVHQINIPVLWFWPNVDAGSDGTSNAIRTFRETNECDNFHFFKNMAPDDFLRLICNARCLVGNSSVGIRESSFLGVPVVNIGTRQAGRDRSHNVVDKDYESQEIATAIGIQMEHGPYPRSTLYGNGQAGYKIAQILAEAELTIDKKLTYS